MSLTNDKISILVPNFEGEFETYAGPFPNKEAAEEYAAAVWGNAPRPAIMIVQEVGFLETIPA